MGWQLIAFVMVLYAWVAVVEGLRGNIAMAIVFAGYAFSNIGLAYLSWKGLS